MKWIIGLSIMVMSGCHAVQPAMVTEVRPCEVAIVTAKDRQQLTAIGILPNVSAGDVVITGACYQERIIQSILRKVSHRAKSFKDTICTIRGDVYQDPTTMTFTKDRLDGVCDVNIHVLDRTMVLSNDRYWVLIHIPADVRGHESFVYMWGNEQAYIHGRPVPIEWGYLWHS